MRRLTGQAWTVITTTIAFIIAIAIDVKYPIIILLSILPILDNIILTIVANIVLAIVANATLAVLAILEAIALLNTVTSDLAIATAIPIRALAYVGFDFSLSPSLSL